MARSRPALVLLVSVAMVACGDPGCEDYAAWELYEDPGGRFSVRYMTPPWTLCSGTEFADDCRECPSKILGRQTCGGSSLPTIFWVEPLLLDPEFLLIPSYKLEITWHAGTADPLEQAVREQTRMDDAGLTIQREAREFEFFDGTVGAEVAYRGPVHILTGDLAIARPDEREYRVVYAQGDRLVYRIALDSGIDADVPEAEDMLASFAVGGGGE